MKSAACLLLLALSAPAVAQSLQDVPLTDFSGPGWSMAAEAWTLWDSAVLQTKPGGSVLVGTTGPATTKWEHGDLDLEMDYLVARGTSAGVLLQGRYEIRIADSWGTSRPTAFDAGGIAPRNGEWMSGHAPRVNAARAPGLWQHLRIVFKAPRFDDRGRKLAPARIEEVVLNGITVQKSVELEGPTTGAPARGEGGSGPLVLAGGPVAVRNIRSLQFEPVEPIQVSNVSFEYFPGEFSSLSDLDAVEPARRGEMFGYVWDLFGYRADRFGTKWQGTLHLPRSGEVRFDVRFNWIDEIPYAEDAVAGKGLLTIDGEEVVTHTGADSTASGTVFLTEGEHAFALSYFKNRKLWRPIVFLRATGPGMSPQLLNAPRSLPEPESSAPPMPVEPGSEPYVLRSFVDYGGEKTVEGVSVGDPAGVHYTLDLATGGLLYAWKGEFVDAGSMWYSRGERQVAEPLGLRIELPGGPSLAALEDADAPWPDTPADFVREGYRLEGNGRPVFSYSFDDVHVADRLEPIDGGLERRLELSSANQEEVFLRIAAGDIRERKPGVYSVDDRYFVRVPAGVRLEGGELRMPITFESGKARADYSIIW